MKNDKKEVSTTDTERRFVPKARNFKVSASYEGLTSSGKQKTLEALKRQYAR
ncbi:hypothetical protein LZU85_01255 [Vibrio sp. IRLE0018]|uniref:hypothetical protein n=1 Tax=Vibrio floridensis TaxID=2908007 RepID=UPI001F4853FB|nr:hypothetical protein [Vibrio floridensis]MCF8777413.1 hypothetical protein [Vibrio floridensis]